MGHIAKHTTLFHFTISLQDIVKKCEQYVSDHEDYERQHRSACTWLDEARAKYAACEALSNSMEDLQKKQSGVQV